MPEQSNQAEESYQLETLAVHAGTKRSQFNEHSEALFLTSSYVFDSAAQAAARFIGAEPGNIYSRFTNPTVTMFEERLAALEGAEQCGVLHGFVEKRGSHRRFAQHIWFDGKFVRYHLQTVWCGHDLCFCHRCERVGSCGTT